MSEYDIVLRPRIKVGVNDADLKSDINRLASQIEIEVKATLNDKNLRADLNSTIKAASDVLKSNQLGLNIDTSNAQKQIEANLKSIKPKPVEVEVVAKTQQITGFMQTSEQLLKRVKDIEKAFAKEYSARIEFGDLEKLDLGRLNTLTDGYIEKALNTRTGKSEVNKFLDDLVKQSNSAEEGLRKVQKAFVEGYSSEELSKGLQGYFSGLDEIKEKAIGAKYDLGKLGEAFTVQDTQGDAGLVKWFDDLTDSVSKYNDMITQFGANSDRLIVPEKDDYIVQMVSEARENLVNLKQEAVNTKQAVGDIFSSPDSAQNENSIQKVSEIISEIDAQYDKLSKRFEEKSNKEPETDSAIEKWQDNLDKIETSMERLDDIRNDLSFAVDEKDIESINEVKTVLQEWNDEYKGLTDTVRKFNDIKLESNPDNDIIQSPQDQVAAIESIGKTAEQIAESLDEISEEFPTNLTGVLKEEESELDKLNKKFQEHVDIVKLAKDAESEKLKVSQDLAKVLTDEGKAFEESGIKAEDAEKKKSSKTATKNSSSAETFDKNFVPIISVEEIKFNPKDSADLQNQLQTYLDKVSANSEFKTSDLSIKFDEKNEASRAVATFKNDVGDTVKQVYGLQSAISEAGDEVKQLTYLGGDFKKSFEVKPNSVSASTSQLESTISKLQQFQISLDKIKYSSFDSPKAFTNPSAISEVTAKYNEVSDLLTTLQNKNEVLSKEEIRQYQSLRSELDAVIRKYRDIESVSSKSSVPNQDAINRVNQQVEILRTRIDRAKVSWDKMLGDPEIMSRVNSIQAALSDVGGDPKKYQELSRQWQLLSHEIAKAELNTKSFGSRLHETFTRLSAYMVNVAFFGTLTNILRETVKATLELNEAMTDLQVVTGWNNVQAKESVKLYNEYARTLGVTTKAVMEGADSWFNKIDHVKPL